MPLGDRLADRHRVLAFDRPGFGYSERPREITWTPEAQMELILQPCGSSASSGRFCTGILGAPAWWLPSLCMPPARSVVWLPRQAITTRTVVWTRLLPSSMSHRPSARWSAILLARCWAL